MFENHTQDNRRVGIVQPGTTVGDIKRTGNEIFVWFNHGHELIGTPIPDGYSEHEIVDAYTMKHDGPLTQAEGTVDGAQWSFMCESGNVWTVCLTVEPLFTSERQRKARAYMIEGHVYKGEPNNRTQHHDVVGVEID